VQIKPRKNILKVIRIELLVQWKNKISDVEAVRLKRNERLCEIEKDMSDYCILIKETKSATVRRAFESKIEELEMEQTRLGEKAQKTPAPNYDFEPALNKVFEFIKDPFLMWKTGDLAQKRLVLRMVFDELLIYDYEKGFYTATLSLPLELSCVPELDKLEMVEMPGVEPGSNV
jgi:site-specific DNA recombinase